MDRTTDDGGDAYSAMDDTDDVYADDDFDLIGVLEEAEREHLNKQQQRTTNDNNDNATTSTNTALVDHSNEQRQRHASMEHATSQTHTDSLSNWEEMRLTPDHYGNTEQAIGMGAPTVSAAEYDDYKRMKDIELENVLRDAARLRSELSFSNQELEAKNALLRGIQNSRQRDAMEIDQPGPSHANPDNTCKSTPSISRRTSTFPTRLEFTGRGAVKRPRISSSPSLPPAIEFGSRPSQLITAENRQQLSVEQPAFDRAAFEQAVNAKVAQQLRNIRHEVEQELIKTKERDVEEFFQCLAKVDYVKEQLDKTPPSSLELWDIVADGLRPARVMEGFEYTVNVLANDTLNMLAKDISVCLSQVSVYGVEATLSQILILLRGVIQLCVSDHKEKTFVRVVDLFFTLSNYYPPYITAKLEREISEAGDQSTLYYLVKGLLLIPPRDASEGPSMHPFIQGIPGIADMKYSQIKAYLQVYTFGPSDIREILTGVTSDQCQQTTSMVLKILKLPSLSDRSLFILDQQGFMDLISPQKPLELVTEALDIIHDLLGGAPTDWLSNETYRSLLKTISSFILLPRPSDPIELQWYRLKIASIQIFQKILAVAPAALSPSDAYDMALSPSIYTVNNEYFRVQSGKKPPFVSVPSIESDNILVRAVSLMLQILLIHHNVLFKNDDDEENGRVYMEVLSSLKGLTEIMGPSLQRRIRPTLNKLAEIIKEKAPS